MWKFSLFFIVALLFIPTSGCYAKGPWRGKVVDAETKQPIEGAAVVAVWIRETGTPAGTDTGFVDAAETLTDKTGDFEIPSKRFLSIIGIRHIKGPFFTFYKPGFSATPKWVTKMPYDKRTQSDYFEVQGASVELSEAITKEQRLEALHNAEFDLDYFRKAKLRKIFKLINEENKNLGFEGYKEEN